MYSKNLKKKHWQDRFVFKGVVPVPDTKLSGGGCSHEVNQLDFSWFPTFQLPPSREESETVQTQPCYGALASKHCQIAWFESIFSSPIMKNRATIGWRTPLSKDQNWKQKISPTLWRKCFRMPVWASKSVEWLRSSLILSAAPFLCKKRHGYRIPVQPL